VLSSTLEWWSRWRRWWRQRVTKAIHNTCRFFQETAKEHQCHHRDELPPCQLLRVFASLGRFNHIAPYAVKCAGIARYVGLRGTFELYERPGINTIFRKPYAPKDQRNLGCRMILEDFSEAGVAFVGIGALQIILNSRSLRFATSESPASSLRRYNLPPNRTRAKY
jgi:hypothetical protein